MRVPRSALPLARVGAVASLGCLLLAAPIAFAEDARMSPKARVSPVTRPATAPTQPKAAEAPSRATIRKAPDKMQRVDEKRATPQKSKRQIERLAPTGIATPERSTAPAREGLKAMSPAEELQRKQRAQRFEMEAKRIQSEMANERRRFDTDQQSELARENEKTMARIRSYAKNQGRLAKIREEAAALEKKAAKADDREAKALGEQAAKLLEELEGL